jgi:hypothetical protein
MDVRVPLEEEAVSDGAEVPRFLRLRLREVRVQAGMLDVRMSRRLREQDAGEAG